MRLSRSYDGRMQTAFGIKIACVIAVAAAGCFLAGAQAPGVPICSQPRQESQDRASLLNAAKQLFNGGDALRAPEVRKQLKRTSCRMTLPDASATKLPAREICIAARHSHLRIGWSYLCNKCGKWHLNLAGGYALTAGGAAATCFHVVEPGRELREGCLVAVDETGTALPVTEVLAANRDSDACIVRVGGATLTPLPLNTNLYPGDPVYCYSDPAGHRDYFSAGIVNRFYQLPGGQSSAVATATRINVSTEWAPGSSGSAVLDECGNAIGHVTKISAVPNQPAPKAQDSHTETPAAIVFHEAVSARDVLRLIRPKKD